VRFNPLRVLPHANFIIWSPGFCIDAAHAIRKHLRKLMRDCRGLKGLRLYPDLACYRLQAPEDLRKVTCYSCKPIDLAHAYLNAGEVLNFEPAKMIDLNADVDHFLEFHPMLFLKLRRISRFGRCCGMHHDYLGRVTPHRLRQRERNAERRCNLRALDAAVGIGKYRARPVKLSGFERWESDLRKYGWTLTPSRSSYDYWKEWHRKKAPHIPSLPARINNPAAPVNEPLQILNPGSPVENVSAV